MKPRGRRAGFAVGLTVMLLAAACEPESTSPTTAAQDVSTEITADLTEFEFSPNAWEVPAGSAVMLTLNNQGTMEHTFAVIAEGGLVSPSRSSRRADWSAPPPS